MVDRRGICEAGESDPQAAVWNGREELGIAINGEFAWLGEYLQRGANIEGERPILEDLQRQLGSPPNQKSGE